MVKPGETLPSGQVQEHKMDNTIDLSQELKDGVLVVVPAAFSPTCSNGHIPKYIRQSSEKPTGDIFVIAVNDIFVVNAWAEHLDPGRKSKVRFVADPTGEYVDKLGVLFDATKFFGNKRGHRSAIVVKDGKVVKHEIEEDPLKVIEVSSADKILA